VKLGEECKLPSDAVKIMLRLLSSVVNYLENRNILRDRSIILSIYYDGEDVKKPIIGTELKYDEDFLNRIIMEKLNEVEDSENLDITIMFLDYDLYATVLSNFMSKLLLINVEVCSSHYIFEEKNHAIKLAEELVREFDKIDMIHIATRTEPAPTRRIYSYYRTVRHLIYEVAHRRKIELNNGQIMKLVEKAKRIIEELSKNEENRRKIRIISIEPLIVEAEREFYYYDMFYRKIIDLIEEYYLDTFLH